MPPIQCKGEGCDRLTFSPDRLCGKCFDKASMPRHPGHHLPGVAGPHVIITPQCREASGVDGAWEEAVRRLKECYDGAVAGWGDTPFTAHVAITIEPELSDKMTNSSPSDSSIE